MLEQRAKMSQSGCIGGAECVDGLIRFEIITKILKDLEKPRGSKRISRMYSNKLMANTKAERMVCDGREI